MRAVKRRDPNAEIRIKIFEKVSEMLGYKIKSKVEKDLK